MNNSSSILKLLPKFTIECKLNGWQAVCGIAISSATLITITALITNRKTGQDENTQRDSVN